MPLVTNVQDVRLLTVREVARMLRVSGMTVYRLIETGDLEATRVGRLFRVHEASFDAYLAAHRASPPGGGGVS
jgi:excisionase family DNA binding protein